MLTEAERMRLDMHGINPLQSLRAADPRPLPLRTLAQGAAASADGGWLAWRVLGLAGHPYGGLVPFFIDWGESRHPARSAPRGGTLTGVELVHPQAERLQGFLDGLGLAVPVSRGDRPALRAGIDGARGKVILSSIDPMPSGFAI